MGGPVSYARGKLFETIGVQEVIDRAADSSKAFMAEQLQTWGFSQEGAALGAESAYFGLMIGASTLGAAKADKVLKSAKDVAGAARKSVIKKKDQPWTIREGQEWKAKIKGTGQHTGQDTAHAFRSNRIAVEMAKRKDVTEVTIDRGVNRMLPKGSKIKPNRRPDVTYKTTDGKIHQIEVPSASDDPKKLIARMKDTKLKIPENMQGRTDVKSIKRLEDLAKK
jgi:hypothetical protein